LYELKRVALSCQNYCHFICFRLSFNDCD